MLTYFNTGTVTGKFSAALDQAVREVKNDVEKGENYMTIEEYAARQSAYARKEGREEGREEGRTEERAEKEAQTIKGLVTLNLDKDQIVKFLIDNFNLDKQEALAAYERVMATA